MRSFLQNSFSKKITGLMLGSALCLFGSAASAATFTAKPGTNLMWNGGSTTWTITNGTALNSSFPSYNDVVVIGNGSRVTVNIPVAECAQLTVDVTGAANNSLSLLAVTSNNLRVYGALAVTGGTGNTDAELSVTSGLIEIKGSLAPNAPTGNVGSGVKNIIRVGAGGLIQPNKTEIGPLPVELVSFTATKNNNEVALTWETASEKNNAGFEVQLSADGKNYETLAFVASHNGNSSAAQRYAYSHKTANKEGLVYYRLKQTDLNGESEYYTAKVVDLGRFSATVNTFPNPFQNRFELNLTAAAAETASIQVVDMAGKTVYQAEQKLQKGANTLNVELSNQPAGLYLLKATAGNQTYTNRLVKQ